MKSGYEKSETIKINKIRAGSVSDRSRRTFTTVEVSILKKEELIGLIVFEGHFPEH